jgi:hypothetical protein
MIGPGRTLAFLLVLLLCPAAPVQADAGFAFLKNTNPQFRFENLSDYPDHDFYLKYGHSPGNPYAATFVTPVAAGTLTRLEGEGNRITPVILIAVPHGAPPPSAQTKDPEWLVKAEPGTLQSEPLNWDLGTARYRILLDNERLQAVWQGNEWVAGSTWLVIVGVALCILLTLAGFIFVRRWRLARGAKKEV